MLHYIKAVELGIIQYADYIKNITLLMMQYIISQTTFDIKTIHLLIIKVIPVSFHKI